MLPVMPGLIVKGAGKISLPVGKEQAELLSKVARQAPFGKGMETVVDMSVRNTLEIEPSQVSLENPSWDDALNKLVQHAAESLGVQHQLVNAHLYKLLLYGPGGFFKKHRDTEKADGMFASLVVQLPSSFTGRSFRVRHGGAIKTFNLGAGNDSEYVCHFVSHYADCEHEIKNIESG